MNEIRVTVVYALPDAATEIALRLPAGATVAEAIERSGIAGRPGVCLAADGPVGIFGERVRRDTVLAEGDRVELYRPLSTDSKASRRRRVVNKKR